MAIMASRAIVVGGDAAGAAAERGVATVAKRGDGEEGAGLGADRAALRPWLRPIHRMNEPLAFVRVVTQ